VDFVVSPDDGDIAEFAAGLERADGPDADRPLVIDRRGLSTRPAPRWFT
jgi:hypothetical protein